MKHPNIVIRLIVLVVVTLIASAPVTAQQRVPNPHSRFGIVEAYYSPENASDLNLGWERIIFEWRYFQPNGPNDFNTDVIPETWLQDARDNGRQVVGLLKNTPYWASGTDLLGSPPTGLDLPIDDPNNYWAAFVQQTVRYYSENWDIHHWIIYNEPDIRPGDMGTHWEFDGTVWDYAKMVKVAYLAAHAVDPDAKIHLAGMAWFVDVAAQRPLYLEGLLYTLAQDPQAYENNFYFDVITVHVYFGTLNVWNLIYRTKTLLGYYGIPDKEIWVDETNALPTEDPQTPMPDYPFQVTLEQQSDFIVQSAATALAAGASHYGIYRLFDDHFVPGQSEPWGLVRADGTRRPAFTAYQTAIQWFNDTTAARRYYSDNSVTIVLEQPERTIYVMWARSTRPVTFNVAANTEDETGTYLSVYGTTLPIAPITVPRQNGYWFQLQANPAIADANENVVVEGSPMILVVEGGPRLIWIEVGGVRWWYW